MAITHSVFFNLVHPEGSQEERAFFDKSVKILAPIPGVDGFQVLEQTSQKAPFRFGFSMQFATQKQYDSYNNHPDHVNYVEHIWLSEVSDFQEMDHIPHPDFS